MILVGAGLSGLIAANILRGEVEAIWEHQQSLPNNHNAILRFRSDLVSQATNIPFKKVSVMKTVAKYGNPFADMITYSLKVTGMAQSRSIVTAGGELVDRYIAPQNFVDILGDRVKNKIKFARKFKSGDISDGGPYISTMPMPALMNIMGYPHDKEIFSYRKGYVVRGQLPNFNAYGTVYIPNPTTNLYRVSITGDELFAECGGQLPVDGEVSKRAALYDSLHVLGLVDHMKPDDIIDTQIKEMQYAKINPIHESIRKEFIIWASDRDVYSLGRFATWRSNLLLDDLVNDVNVIRRLAGGDKEINYQLKLGE